MSCIYDTSKRFIDILLSLAGLIILAPLLFLVSILIKLESRGNIIFVQERVGLNGKPFKSQMKYNLKEYIPFWSIFPHNYRKIIERNFIGTEHHAFPDWGKVTDEKILSLINGTYKSSKK